MDCADHVISRAAYVGVCEFAASGKLSQLSGSSSSGNIPLTSQIVSSICDGGSGLTVISSLSSIGEDKSIMFKTYIVALC